MRKKYCPGCEQEKLVSQFAKKSSAKDGLQARCKECRNAYCRQHYASNKSYYLTKNQRRRAELRDWIIEHKSKLRCNRCEFDDWRALHFHHSDPSKKEYTIATMANRGGSIKRIEQEIAKCEVLCANCHTIEHCPVV